MRSGMGGLLGAKTSTTRAAVGRARRQPPATTRSRSAGRTSTRASVILQWATASYGVSDAVRIAVRAPALRATGSISLIGPTTSDVPTATKSAAPAAAVIARRRSAATSDWPKEIVA